MFMDLVVKKVHNIDEFGDGKICTLFMNLTNPYLRSYYERPQVISNSALVLIKVGKLNWRIYQARYVEID